ncbi:type 1 glutamine amidotransferase [Colwellia psychrerythraea]|uniref:Peptidase C26 n=1 Tax=Colwellia psychrerythraea TaxID=28229 RepID=A0A099KLQ4_COLPS|nr:type 1 glutamine amidotransferase [Colwellia psychrerythraea]KGJ90887.1 peptidase C26 [Colwellia psychrerythraea]
MKRIGITQRVEWVKSYGERRDCLDQQWSNFVIKLGGFPLPLANLPAEKVEQLLTVMQLDGIILTGGNSLTCLNPQAGDTAPERDNFERTLINLALKKNIPIVGVCRGMQLINLVMAGSLIKISGHVAIKHTIEACSTEFELPKVVNSFHHYGISCTGLAESLLPLACDEVGNIEAFFSTRNNILGIMWHPEREAEFSQFDMQLFKRFLL